MSKKADALDREYAAVARRHGIAWPLRVVQEGRRAGIGPALALAMAEQESGGRNVWGHDPAPNGGTSSLSGHYVREKDYRAYKARRGPSGRGGMQGVGPLQLTWYEFQDEADRRGGCWVPRINLRVGFERLAALIKQYGLRGGIARYNGTGPRAVAYSVSVLARRVRWRVRLFRHRHR